MKEKIEVFRGMKIVPEEKDLIAGFVIGDKREKVENRFSGEEVELSPEAVAVYDLVIGCEFFMHKFPRSEKHRIDFFNARDVFIRNWPKEYMILLD